MLKEIYKYHSKNFDKRRKIKHIQDINMLVFHYTGMLSCNIALKRLCDPSSKVSSHFLIDENGDIYRLVEDKFRAWHAGRSYWRGEEDINSVSIGIELVNPGHDISYKKFPDSQISSLIDLSLELIAKYNISKERIVGHSDISPGRKKDPGELFPWRELASKGIGIWPMNTLPIDLKNDFWKNLSIIGYAHPNQILSDGKRLGADINSSDIIFAFQRHFMPSHITGELDVETFKMVNKVANLF